MCHRTSPWSFSLRIYCPLFFFLEFLPWSVGGNKNSCLYCSTKSSWHFILTIFVKFDNLEENITILVIGISFEIVFVHIEIFIFDWLMIIKSSLFTANIQLCLSEQFAFPNAKDNRLFSSLGRESSSQPPKLMMTTWSSVKWMAIGRPFSSRRFYERIWKHTSKFFHTKICWIL